MKFFPTKGSKSHVLIVVPQSDDGEMEDSICSTLNSVNGSELLSVGLLARVATTDQGLGCMLKVENPTS